MTHTETASPCAQSATSVSPFLPLRIMKCQLSLKRLNGKRLASDRGEVRHRLVPLPLSLFVCRVIVTIQIPNCRTILLGLHIVSVISEPTETVRISQLLTKKEQE